MNKNKGFIATSLIYSFFLVFIAIMAALISNFVANKTILLRFNEDLEDQKNKETFNFKLVSRGSENFKIKYGEEGEEIVDIQGRTLTNLIQDSKFINNEFRWVQDGSINFYPNNLFEMKTGALLRNSYSNTSIHQENIMSIYNNKYYFSIEYASNYPNLFQTTFKNTSTAQITLPSNNLTWQRVGMTYSETNTLSGPYNIFYIKNTGVTDSNFNPIFNSEAHFTNAMLINLTAHYDPGREPEADWMNKNIEYFDGTINYITDSFINRGEEILIKMYTTQKDFKNIKNLNCIGLSGEWASAENIETKIEYDNSTEKYYGFLTIKNISDDVECSLEWGI